MLPVPCMEDSDGLTFTLILRAFSTAMNVFAYAGRIG